MQPLSFKFTKTKRLLLAHHRLGQQVSVATTDWFPIQKPF
ncbi:hypothetical protein CLOSTMETH_02296 [[Clostridium] methylpentosum DSM 5476]|uniref:Uncharacterized protein n=1 Tax=[Clostridium] methylpentosum DSM 5476 TaxID=537013 RepID=C0EEK5_9FIRM|nr:hypothetical protein CLOSTMETH_02296 [[Clostridium] methylpentosum DSM 5476]